MGESWADLRDTKAMPIRSAAARAGSEIAKQYAQALALLVPALAGVCWVATRPASPLARPTAILGPVVGLLALTTVVFFAMFFARHAAILLRKAPIAFFRNFDGAEVADWVERPARAFNNLMQVPTVFYAASALMLQTGLIDSVQLALAWLFLAARVVHAIIFVGWNAVNFRFASALVAFVALGALLFRFAMQSLPLWWPLDSW